jgi:hypothetical protein
MIGQRHEWWLKMLRLLIKVVSWGIILLSALAMPLLLYQFYAVTWGGTAVGEVIYLDARVPARGQAIVALAINCAILACGIMVEHFGTRAIDRFSAGRQPKA